MGDPADDSDASNKKYVDLTDKKLRKQITEEVILIQNALDGKVDKGKQIDMKGERIINLGMSTGKNDAASRRFVLLETAKNLALSGGKMIGSINIGQHKLWNLPRPISLSDAATNEYVDQSFVDPSGSMKNVFQYIMDDVDETSSESNITVLGILDFPKSPHLLNKKAIKFQMGKNADGDKFSSSLGLNMGPLPTGDFTLVVEFFPPIGGDVFFSCATTTLTIDKQSSTPAGIGAWKNQVHFHKGTDTPPHYLRVDMEVGVDSNSSDNIGWMIVWGVENFRNHVSSSVYDRPFSVESGKIVMETDLDLNGKRLLNYPKSKAVIFGQYKKATSSESETFRINNETGYHVFGFGFTVKKITLHFTVRDGPIVPVNTSVMIKASSKKSASGVDIGNNAISYSFDFVVAANDEFELSLRNRGGIARANVTILIEI